MTTKEFEQLIEYATRMAFSELMKSLVSNKLRVDIKREEFPCGMMMGLSCLVPARLA